MFRRLGHLAMLLAVMLPATLWLSARPSAAQPSEDEVKVGFVLNFVKYTTWPPGSDEGQLVICADRPLALSGQLDLLNGRQVVGRTVQVRAPVRPSDWRNCRVLVIEGDVLQAAEGMRAIATTPVLTISDEPGFIAAGGMISLKLRAGRVRFDIDQAAARRAGLTLSSQLLKLADEVKQ